MSRPDPMDDMLDVPPVTHLPGTADADRTVWLASQILDSKGLDEIPDPEPLIDGLLDLNSIAWLHGKPGSAKSFVALDWAACVSLGLPWQDREVTEGPVLYVIAEGVSGMGKRKRAWEEQAQCRMQVQFLPVPVQIGASRDRIPFVELAAGIKPVLIVFDTQARVSVGLDENSAKDMGVLVNAAEEIRKATGACVLFVHHESRAGENLRGSTALEGAAATRIRVAKDGPLVCLTNPKQKDAAEADRIDLALKPAGSSAVIVSPDRETIGLPDAEKRVMATFRETFGETIAVSRSDIMEASRLTKSTCCRALKTLVADGLLTNVGTAKRPMYQLPEASP